MVSGPDRVTVERNGNLAKTPVRFRDPGHLERTARDLAASASTTAPCPGTTRCVTVQLPGARVQFVMRPVAATAGSLIVIRKFRRAVRAWTTCCASARSTSMAAFLRDAIAARATVLVSGGTGSGKTTLINALCEFIPDTERVITIEDALELQLRNTHVESLVTKEAASADDQLLIGQDELLQATLRMRPDRIIVGEIRDGRGCSVMLQAANTGHDGTMTTIHANTPDLAIGRMADLLREERADAGRRRPQPGDDRDRRRRPDRPQARPPLRLRRSPSSRPAATRRQLTTPLFAGEFPSGAAAPVFAPGRRPRSRH